MINAAITKFPHCKAGPRDTSNLFNLFSIHKASAQSLLTIFIAFAGVPSVLALPVFPGAEGFGTATTAGSGRHLMPVVTQVIKVTSLEDSGVGTLRACIDTQAPRTCIFEVSGEIKLESALIVAHPYLTIAGQTAPTPGIILTRAGIRVETNDVLIQHLTVRVGDAPGTIKPDDRDAVAVGASKGTGAFNVVLDHLSLGWGIDENFSTWKPTTHDVTLSNSFVVEGLDNSIHSKGPHSKGILIGDGTKRVSLIRNLIAHNIERNPYFKPDTSGEVVNNLVYGWGPKGGWSLCNVSENTGNGLPVQLIFTGNVYKPGPTSARVPALYAKPPAPLTRVYVKDNLGPTRTSSTDDDWKIASIPESPFRSEAPPIPGSGVVLQAANLVEKNVLASSGARPHARLPVDARVVQEVRDGSGAIKDCVVGCGSPAGGWPVVPTNQIVHILPKEPNADDNKNGYTNLEDWLHDKAVQVEGGSSQ